MKKKKKNPQQFNSVFEIHIHLKMIGRKEGRGEKQRKKGREKGIKDWYRAQNVNNI